MKPILIMLVALVVGLMVACGGESSEYGYPKEVVDNYMTACTNTGEASGVSEKGSKKFCNCTIKELEREYSLVEFQKISEDILQRGLQSAPQKFVEISDACLFLLN
jgi:hypothetical protein